MEFLNYYFGHHKDKKVIYFYGENNSLNALEKTLNTSCFDEFILVFENEADKTKVGESILNQCQIRSMSNLPLLDHYVIVLDHFKNNSDLKIKANKIVGVFDKTVDTYKIWQNFRQFSNILVLAKEFDDERNEVLFWEKEDDNDIELSVILPVYNVEKYLNRCIESLIKWDAPYVEYLFVNDGSSDNSAKVIEEWSKRDSRIKLFNKENAGCASARQFGLERARGKYIGLIDPDDFIDPTMFEKLHSRAMTGNYDVAYCGYNEFYEDTQLSKPVKDVCEKLYVEGTADPKIIIRLISDLRVAIWRGIYKKDLLIDGGIQFHTELRRFDDLPFKVEVYSMAKSVVCVNENLYYYRLGRAGQDVSVNDEHLYVHFDIFKNLDNFFGQNCSSEVLKRYYQVKVQTHYWAVTIIKNELKETYKKLAANDLEIENDKTTWKKLLQKYYSRKEVNAFFK